MSPTEDGSEVFDVPGLPADTWRDIPDSALDAVRAQFAAKIEARLADDRATAERLDEDDRVDLVARGLCVEQAQDALRDAQVEHEFVILQLRRKYGLLKGDQVDPSTGAIVRRVVGP